MIYTIVTSREADENIAYLKDNEITVFVLSAKGHYGDR